MTNQTKNVILLSAAGLFVGYLIGSVYTKQRLIGDTDEDILLFKHVMAPDDRFVQVTPDDLQNTPKEIKVKIL